MRIGIVVDGDSEYRSLPAILSRIRRPCGHDFLGPTVMRASPLAPIGVLGKACSSPIRVLAGRGAHRIVVVLDRETRDECPGDFASQVANEAAQASGFGALSVAVKNRKYENWLIADIDALRRQRARFTVSLRQEARVRPDKADSVSDAVEYLRSCALGRSYDKVADSVRITRLIDPMEMARNSRSFRRFLRLLNHPTYIQQSIRP